MTQKLLLAESLDLLRQGEIKEYDLDKTKERISSSDRGKGELARLVQSYYDVYDQFVRGVEILNYVRCQALEDRNPNTVQYNRNLSDFCAGKMSAYMDRCDNVIRKVDEIRLPLDQVDLVTKEGYVPGETLYIQDGASYPLTRKEKVLAKEFTLMDGTYIVVVKNRDKYTIAAPAVDVVLTITPQRGSGAEPQRVAQSLPTDSGWRKVVGVVGAATLQLEVRTSGIRDAHVDVLVQKWAPAAGGSVAGSSNNGGGPGESPFAGAAMQQFSSDFASVHKPGNGNGGGAGGNYGQPQMYGHYGPDSSSAATTGLQSANGPQQQQQQQWAGGFPAIPDDDLAALANYNVPQGELPKRGGGECAAAAQAHPSPPAEDPWTALENLTVPHVDNQGGSCAGAATVPLMAGAMPVATDGLTCKERLQRVRQVLDTWPNDAMPTANLPQDAQRIVQTVYAMPLPNDIS